jgi:hypothetical protein
MRGSLRGKSRFVRDCASSALHRAQPPRHPLTVRLRRHPRQRSRSKAALAFKILVSLRVSQAYGRVRSGPRSPPRVRCAIARADLVVVHVGGNEQA